MILLLLVLAIEMIAATIVADVHFNVVAGETREVPFDAGVVIGPTVSVFPGVIDVTREVLVTSAILFVFIIVTQIGVTGKDVDATESRLSRRTTFLFFRFLVCLFFFVSFVLLLCLRD